MITNFRATIALLKQHIFGTESFSGLKFTRDVKVITAIVLQVELKKHEHVYGYDASKLRNYFPGHDEQAFSTKAARLRLDLVEKSLQFFSPTLRWN